MDKDLSGGIQKGDSIENLSEISGEQRASTGKDGMRNQD